MEAGERGGGGANNELRTARAGMEVGGEEMDDGEETKVDKYVEEAEEGQLGGGCWHWNPQGS